MSNLSFIRHVGDNITTSYALAIAGENMGYFRVADIKVFVDDVEVPSTIETASPHIVIITPAPASGADILIRREMPVDKPYADFARGNNFGHRQVNNSFLQQLYLTQQLVDGFKPIGSYEKQNLDMGGNKIINLGTPTIGTDAATYKEVQGIENRLAIIENGYTPNGDIKVDIKTFKPTFLAGDTVINVPDTPDDVQLHINGDLQVPILFEGDTGNFTYIAGLITLVEPLLGDEVVTVSYGLLVPVSTVKVSGMLSFSSVAQMKADPSLLVGERVVTYSYNKRVICFWEIASSGNALLGDVLLNNTEWAILQVQPIMSMRHYGAFGNGVDDDTPAAKRMALVNARCTDNTGDIHLLTDQIILQNNFKYKSGGARYEFNGKAGTPTIQGRDWAVFQAMGIMGSNIDVLTLTTGLVEFTESFYYVGNEAAFAGREDTYMLIFAGTSAQPTIPMFSLMPKFIGISGTGRCQLDYRNGWDIPAGQGITYREVTPIYGIEIDGLNIRDISPDSVTSGDYASAISLGLAHHCQLKNITGTEFRNPIIFAEWSTDCFIDGGRIERPRETGGGQGYFVQWNSCLRCDSSNITGYLSRHLVDHTQSAYCNVLNVRDSNSADGALTNHGAYEHDISYNNCVGFHSIGNSGASFGETCKRITIINGNGRYLDADRNIIDLTIINSRFSFATVNSQGFQAQGLTITDEGTGINGLSIRSTTIALGRNTLSKRPNLLNGCSFPLNFNYFLTDFNFTGGLVELVNCNVKCYISNPILTGAVHVTGGTWEHVASGIQLTADSSMSIVGTKLIGFGVRQNDGNDNCYFKAKDCEIIGIPTAGFYSCRMNTGSTGILEMSGLKIDGVGGVIIDMPEVDQTNGIFLDISHNTFINGLITIKNIYTGAGKMMYTNNLFDTVTQDVPATGGRRLNTNNITV